jgi:hypothetical protein
MRCTTTGRAGNWVGAVEKIGSILVASGRVGFREAESDGLMQHGWGEVCLAATSFLLSELNLGVLRSEMMDIFRIVLFISEVGENGVW